MFYITEAENGLFQFEHKREFKKCNQLYKVQTLMFSFVLACKIFGIVIVDDDDADDDEEHGEFVEIFKYFLLCLLSPNDDLTGLNDESCSLLLFTVNAPAYDLLLKSLI